VGAEAVRIFGIQWQSLIAVILTLLILYFSEIIPKTIGANYWRELAEDDLYIFSRIPVYEQSEQDNRKTITGLVFARTILK